MRLELRAFGFQRKCRLVELDLPPLGQRLQRLSALGEIVHCDCGKTGLAVAGKYGDVALEGLNVIEACAAREMSIWLRGSKKVSVRVQYTKVVRAGSIWNGPCWQSRANTAIWRSKGSTSSSRALRMRRQYMVDTLPKHRHWRAIPLNGKCLDELLKKRSF